MSENNQPSELSKPSSEYSIKDHNEFVAGRADLLARRAGRVLGLGLVGTGATFALVGIGDFITGGGVSRTLMQINPSTAPEIVSWAAQHMAQVPELIKLVGGSSMIATGTTIVNRLSR